MSGIARLGSAADILRYVDEHGPITIGLAGAGQMGTDIVVQLALMPGVRLGAISEVRLDVARNALLLAGHTTSDIIETSNPVAVDSAID